MTSQQKVVAGLADKYPHASTNSLARAAMKEYPGVFKTFNAADLAIRRARGATGKRNRDRGKFRVPMPKGRKQLGDWELFKINGPIKALVLSDVHVPYHDEDSLAIAMDYGRRQKVDCVLLNGDMIDFFSISRWENDPRERDLNNEVKTLKSLLDHMKCLLPNARFIYKLGNHEERWTAYLRNKAPELLGLDSMDLGHVLGLNELNIEMVGHKLPIQLGRLNVLHGHEYRFSISNPVNPARGLFLRTKSYALCGHFHQSSHHTEKNVEDGVIATWSTGCLCDLHPEYLPLNNWCHGFAYVEVEAGGKFHVQNKIIRQGRIY